VRDNWREKVDAYFRRGRLRSPAAPLERVRQQQDFPIIAVAIWVYVGAQLADLLRDYLLDLVEQVVAKFPERLTYDLDHLSSLSALTKHC
jgi:hypothetical protein